MECREGKERMEPTCEYCGKLRAVIYCKSDLARLCLNCDSCIHSANSLSFRHSRSLLCDKCNLQPAVVRYLDEKLSICQKCDSKGSLNLEHSHRALSCYTGCPSFAEFSSIWSTVLDAPLSSGYVPGVGPVSSMLINENSTSNCLVKKENEGPLESCDKFETWMPSPTILQPNTNDVPYCRDQELESYHKFEPWMVSPANLQPYTNDMHYCRDQANFLPDELNLSKVSADLKNLGRHSDEDLFHGLKMEDVSLNFENNNEMFVSSLGHTRYELVDVVNDSILTDKNFSFTSSNGFDETIEASSAQHDSCASFQASHITGAASTMQALSDDCNGLFMNSCCNTNIGLEFPASNEQAHSSSSLSVLNITGDDSSVAEYKDCGVSRVFLTGDSPWESNLKSKWPQGRESAVKRYYEKKRKRTFGKQIRYASRKARADTRKRVKGRFVKAGQAYDYDPIMASDL